MFLSTGISSSAEINGALKVLGKDNLILMHATSASPPSVLKVNLRAIPAT